MDTEKYYPNGNFGDITDGIGTTKTFRSYLKNYIRTYKPQCLRKGKEYLLILDNNGEFRVTHPKLPVDTVPNLSESENILYHYLCFLNLSEFWYGIEQIKDIHYVTTVFRSTWEMCQLLDKKYLNSSKKTLEDFYKEAKKNKWIKD